MTNDDSSSSEPRNIEEFAAYLREIEPRLLGVIRHRMGDHLRRKVEPEDILQEVNADAVRTFEKQGISGGDLFPWLCRLVERKIVDSHRYFFEAKKRDAARERVLNPGAGSSQQRNFLQYLMSSLTTPSQAFSRQAREARLTEAIESLPELQQQALRLRYVEGLPSKQIAQSLGKSDASIRVMLTRTIKRLQTELED